MTIKINNQDWKIQVLSDYMYRKHVDPSTLAMTFYDISSDEEDARVIFFNKRHFTRQIILHELMHAYLAYQPTKKKMRRDTFEEIFCEFFEKHFDSIHRVAHEIEEHFLDRQ